MAVNPVSAQRPGTVPRVYGESSGIRLALAQADRFAATQVPVLIVGETGTGKELLARYVHAKSGRLGELVDLNCGALPREMIESLLFGHRRGAFTGAVEDRVGLAAQAHGGTLFLDELASLPVEGQAKLLRLLETGEVRRLGDSTKRWIDFRLVAAAQDDFAERVRAGQFRRDLYYRIDGVRLELPPLRARPEDIAALSEHFAAGHGRSLEPGATALLRAHPWPGNVRELRSVIERAAVMSSGSTLTGVAIAEALGQGGERREEATVRRAFRAKMEELCAQYGSDALLIAAALRISRATLYRRLKHNGIKLQVVSKSQRISDGRETG